MQSHFAEKPWPADDKGALQIAIRPDADEDQKPAINARMRHQIVIKESPIENVAAREASRSLLHERVIEDGQNGVPLN